VIHIAAHVDAGAPSAPGEANPLAGRPRIPLSLHSDGSADALFPEALIRLQLPSSVVVLSGCDSSRGKARPGLGLTGLSQAWILGGASAVVGSLWPVPDNSSPLFADFYGALAEGRHPGEALRLAQLASLRSAGWRADPGYWAAWTLTSNK